MQTQLLNKQYSEDLHQSSRTDSVRIYLREIGRVPLLSHEQEIGYGKQVQQMMSLLEAKKALSKKLRPEPTLSEWAMQVQMTEVALNEALRAGQRSKQKMIEANLRLVVAIAKKYQKRNMEFLDLIQEGNMGLTRGVEKFDPTKGYRFSTYAYWWIRQAITRAIAQQARTIRLPIHITDKLNQIKKAQRQLVHRLRRAATIPEIATELKIAPQLVRHCLEWAQHPMSLDMRVGEDQDLSLGELLEDTGISPEEFVMCESQADELERLIAELTAQQQQVLTLRFGLGDGKKLTLAKIGERLNLSREHVRQIEQKALKRLRHLVEIVPEPEDLKEIGGLETSEELAASAMFYRQLSLFEKSALTTTSKSTLQQKQLQNLT